MMVDICIFFFVAKDKDGKDQNLDDDINEEDEEEDVESLAIGSFKIQRSINVSKQMAIRAERKK